MLYKFSVATYAVLLLLQVLLRDNEAYGIEMLWNNTVRQVRAKKEVILSAGTIESPHLLMLSGIGPRRLLENHDVSQDYFHFVDAFGEH